MKYVTKFYEFSIGPTLPYTFNCALGRLGDWSVRIRLRKDASKI